MKRILIIWALLISVCFAQSKPGFYVVGGKVITVQDTSSRKYLKAVEKAGVVPSVAQNFASNYLVTTERAISTWTLMKAQYPFIGGTAGTHKFNLNDPRDLDAAFRLTFDGGGWNHGFIGIIPNGTSSFANTYLNESSQLSLNDKHISVYVNSNSDNTGADIGVYNNSNSGTNIFTRLSNSIYLRNSTNGGIDGVNSNSLGYYINNRISSSIKNYYKNSVNIANTSSSSVSLVNQNYYISAVGYSSGTNPQNYSNRAVSYVSIGSGLTDSKAILQSKIIDFFNSIISRSINRPFLATYFGDSITQGYDGSTVITNKWTTLLSANRGLTENNKGISGTTMQNTSPTDLYGTSMRNRLSEILTPNSNDAYLFISYGVNDCRVSTNYTAAIYGTQLGEVIDNAISKGWNVSKIKVLTPYLITDYGVGDLTKLLDIRTQVINVSSVKGVQCLDVYSAMSLSDVSADNIHPNATGYQTIANYINSVLN